MNECKKKMTFRTVVLRLAFTPTKDYSPKRQFFFKFIHYGIKFINLITFKTVSLETPTQHSIYDIFWVSNRLLNRIVSFLFIHFYLTLEMDIVKTKKNNGKNKIDITGN